MILFPADMSFDSPMVLFDVEQFGDHVSVYFGCLHN